MAKDLSIGKLGLRNPLILAPMADVNKPSFRLLCKEKGAGLVFTEMINAEGAVRDSERTMTLAKTLSKERPLALQIFGSRIAAMGDAAAAFQRKADIIDINCGCPVPRVMRSGAGCALMKDPKRIGDIVKAATSAVDVPITVKMRLGPSKSCKNFLEVGRIAEDSGAAAITMHARTREQGYSGEADWGAIAELKRSVAIPVVGNGDVRGPQDCKRMMDETACDFVMIGRAALGNPYIFKQCVRFLEDGEMLPPQSGQERLKDFRRLLALHEKYDRMSPSKSVVYVRQQAVYFTTGMVGGVEARDRISKARTREEIIGAFRDLISLQGRS